jgi:hypothetical protein
VPPSWRTFALPDGITPAAFVADYCARVVAERALIDASASGATAEVPLGLLFAPAAYLTALRQAASRATGVAVERLELRVALGTADRDKAAGVQWTRIRGVVLRGATSDAVSGVIGIPPAAQDIRQAQAVPHFAVAWVPVPEGPTAASSADSIVAPLYLNEQRRDLVASCRVAIDGHVAPGVYLQRGVCFTAWQ